MKLYLIRHGETTNNTEHKIGGIKDYGLTKKGELQAFELANHLKKDIDRLYCSDLQRAKSTALIIGKKLNISPIITPDLREMDFGDFTDKTFKNIKADNRELFEIWQNDWSNFCAPNGESIKDVYLRVESFLNEQVLCSNDKNIVVVAHQIVIRCIVAFLIGQPNLKMKVKNTGVVTIDVKDNGAYLVFG